MRRRAPLYFSACCEALAVEGQAALRGSSQFYEHHLGVRVGITAVMLTQEDFDRVTAPKQLPFRGAFVTDHPPHLAFIPLGEQSIVNRMYLPRRDRATPATFKLLESAKVSYSEAVSKFMIHLVLFLALTHTKLHSGSIGRLRRCARWRSC